MRKYVLFLIVALLLITSCKDDPNPLAPDLVTLVNAYDLDNNGNSSDIRVDFQVDNNLNVREYRVMILQSKDSSSFTLDVANSIPEGNFLEINPKPFETEYPINRMPANLTDVSGEQIRNGIEYFVVILIEGVDDFQLSKFSRPFTLIDQGIYAGDYEGVNVSSFIKTTLRFAGDKYRGPWIQTSTGGLETFGEMSFMIESDSVKEFTLIFNISCIVYFNGPFPECISGIYPEFCTGEWIGSGTLSDELILQVSLLGPCGVQVCEVMRCELNLILTRL